MADLIDKFFKEDLTEAEKKILGEQLETSDEAARRFGEMASEAYQRFGLPEPQWTGPDKFPVSAKRRSRFWISFCLVFAFLGLLAGWVWLHFHSVKPKSASPSHALPSTHLPYKSNTSVPPQLTKKKPSVPLVQERPSILNHAPVPAQSIPPLPTAVSAKSPSVFINGSLPPLPVVTPRLTPMNLDQMSNQPYSSLSVQLHLSSPRALVVRVLDDKGNELVPLFNGTLQAGTWSFEWNGLLSDGKVAPSGTYEIQVKAGSWTQAKEVEIPK